MRFSNPAMRRWINRSSRGELAVETEPATYAGIAGKTLYFAIVTILAAVASVFLFTYAIQAEAEQLLVGMLIGVAVAAVVMVILSIVIMLAPATVKVLGTVYSLLQGAMLGLVAFIVDLALPGVAVAAVLGTMIVFVLTIVLNKWLGVKVQNKIFRVLFISFLSLIAVEMIMYIASLFMSAESAIMANFWIQLLASGLCIVWATVMLMWDIQGADEVVTAGADKRYEWVISFSLVTTLVYLYVEILEVIIRLAAIFGKRN